MREQPIWQERKVNGRLNLAREIDGGQNFLQAKRQLLYCAFWFPNLNHKRDNALFTSAFSHVLQKHSFPNTP